VRRAVIHGVEGGFAVLAVLPRLLVPADEEYRIVRTGGDRQRCEQIDGERRQSDELVIAQGGDDSARDRKLHEHHHEHEQDRHDGSVDE
jgi:hypothetical protein